MRVDVVSIFPEYLTPLGLSLPGRAQERGLLDLRVHDLRDWTHDRHRTVDDTPYGGGAGMVMRPEPWGEALDALLEQNPGDDDPVLVVPTPSGTPFTQALAAELASRAHLVVACGRYEGIDQRVVDHYSTRVRVREVSVGDYVLNGGEAAALVVLEAVVRLLPGFMGNAESLLEESHEGGLLEYPVYTRPATWRGLDVPAVLLSGDHAKVAAWRREQATARTALRRPDLLHPSRAVTAGGLADAELRLAAPGDAGELWTLHLACAAQEALAGDLPNPAGPATSVAAVARELRKSTTLVLRWHGRLVGSVRGRLDGEEWLVEQLLVVPDLRGRGLEGWLLERAIEAAPPAARWLVGAVGASRAGELRVFHRAGFRPSREPADPGVVRVFRRR